MPDLKKVLPAMVCLLAVTFVAGCGGGGGSGSSEGGETGSSSTPAETGGSSLGAVDKATGKPLVFGMLDLETGPIAFPELREGAQAAVDYINEYKGGIHGHPIEIASCATDGQPATSSRCANQILERDPLLILGGFDTGAPGAMPVWERAKLPYVGGAPVTPVESNSKDAVIFYAVDLADNIAAIAYADEELGVKSAALLNVSDTQGKFTSAAIVEAMENAGMEAKAVSVSPTSSDLAAPAAEAVSADPEMIYVDMPATCVEALQALESVGSTAILMGIDPCTSPQALEAAGPAAEGLYLAQPVESLDSGSADAKLTAAAFGKFEPKAALDSLALIGFGSVMNIYETLGAAPPSDLQSSKILGLFKEGKENPNWLGHPYTCDGEQFPTQAAVCNGYQLIKQVKEGKVVTVSKEWLTGAKYYHPGK